MLTVTLLGTGGTQPLPERALAALAVSVGGGTVLLDCGEGTQTALRRWGVSAYRLPESRVRYRLHRLRTASR